MNPSKAKAWTRRVLMAFVLVTIGFSLGRQTAASSPYGNENSAATHRDHIAIYAAHTTFRCFECIQIETLASELLAAEFSELLEAGEIRFVPVDYIKDTAFASRYDIPASMLVLSRVQGGQETHFERLEDVWMHVRDRDVYMAYVREALQAELEALRKGHP